MLTNEGRQDLINNINSLPKGDIDMKTLLEVYETYRDDAKAKGDGYGFLYWCSRCTEVMSIMENMKDD